MDNLKWNQIVHLNANKGLIYKRKWNVIYKWNFSLILKEVLIKILTYKSHETWRKTFTLYVLALKFPW